MKNIQDIPALFHSSETGTLIQRCLMCDSFLLDGMEYMIEKSISNYPGMNTKDIIHEFALCVDCATSIMNEYSEESAQKMAQYFTDHMDFSRLNKFKTEEFFEADLWVAKCIVKKTPIEECSNYQMSAHCIGDQIIFDKSPLMISGEATDEVADLLSNKTTDLLNKFRDDHFPPPEDLSPLFKEKDFVLL
jgi:hypothetical protein